MIPPQIERPRVSAAVASHYPYAQGDQFYPAVRIISQGEARQRGMRSPRYLYDATAGDGTFAEPLSLPAPSASRLDIQA